MKKSIIFVLTLFVFTMVACSKNDARLTRVDIQHSNYEFVITEKEELKKIDGLLSKVKWEPNTKADMSRKEDLLVTLFYEEEKNMPERLVTHQIWFEKNKNATILSDHEEESYGILDKEYSKDLEEIFSKK